MKQFERRIEDFTCDHCGNHVEGNGYTNHCPNCLWSKHVDVNPGDRAASCGGLMEPIGIDQRNSEWILIHRCQLCQHEKRNKVAKIDSRDTLAELSRQLSL